MNRNHPAGVFQLSCIFGISLDCQFSRAAIRRARRMLADPDIPCLTQKMAIAPSGFDYTVRKDGSVQIVHHGRPASILRGSRAKNFLDDIENDDAQELMARLTGNYKHGNERLARNHPRNTKR